MTEDQNKAYNENHELFLLLQNNLHKSSCSKSTMIHVFNQKSDIITMGYIGTKYLGKWTDSLKKSLTLQFAFSQ